MKVVFKKISVRNFLSIGSIDLNLENKNLCLIEGDNGSGKSSLITDSIIWVIWDETLRGIKKDNVVNRKNKNNCSVSLEVSIDNKDFIITRHRKHSNYKNKLIIEECGKKLNFSTTTQANKYIKSLFPISKDTFLHTVILGQGFQNRFSLLNDSGRKSLLESIINVKIYDVCYDLIKKKYNELDKELQSIKSKKEVIESNSSTIEKEIKKLNESLIDLRKSTGSTKDKLEEEILEISEEISNLTLKLTSLNDYSKEDSLDNYKEEQSFLAIKIGKLENAIEFINKTLKKNNKNIKDAASLYGKCPLCFSPINEEHKEEVIKSFKNENEGLLSDLEDKTKSLTKVNKRFSFIKKELDKNSLEEKRRREKRSSISSRVEFLRDSLDKKNNRISNIKEDENNIERKIEIKQETANNLLTDILTLTARESKKESNLDKYKFWYESFSSKGIRSYILDESIYFINSKIQEYSNILFDDSTSIKLDVSDKEKIEIVSNINGGNYESASGGEKRKIDLCIQFALNDLSTQTSGFSTNILVLDEIFESVDMEGIYSSIQILKKKLSIIDSVFIVTHREFFKSLVDTAYYIIKENGYSKLSD